MPNLEQQSIGDDMRDVRNEWMPKDLRDDAEDVLHIVLEMTPRQRRDALEDLRQAAEFIMRAIRECE